MADTPTSLPAIEDIPHLPTNADAEIVFSNPWEAKAFSLVVHLYQRGHFSWVEWAERLAEEIRRAGPHDDGSDYYLHWLAAAEKILSEKALCDSDELNARKQALETQQGGPAPQ